MAEGLEPLSSLGVTGSLHSEPASAAPGPQGDERLGQLRCVTMAPHQLRPLLGVLVSCPLEEPLELPQVHIPEDVGTAGLPAAALCHPPKLGLPSHRGRRGEVLHPEIKAGRGGEVQRFS